MNTLRSICLLVLTVLGIAAGAIPASADMPVTDHSPVYQFSVRPKSALMPARPSRVGLGTTATSDSSTPGMPSSESPPPGGPPQTIPGGSTIPSSQTTGGAPVALRSSPSRHERKRQYEQSRKAGEAQGWFDCLVDRVAGTDFQNAGSFLDGLRNTDNIADAEQFKNTPMGKRGQRLGAWAERAEFLIKIARIYQEYEQDERRAVKQGSFTAVKEMAKFFLGNVVGGKAAATLIVPVSTVLSPVAAVLVVGAAAWGATTLTEKAIETASNRYFHPLHDTARTGALNDEIVDWLGTRTEKGFTLDFDWGDIGGRPQFFPPEIPPEKIVEILRTAQANCLDRARELVTPPWTPFGPANPTAKTATLGELADLIPYEIVTEEQLEVYVRQQAERVVRNGMAATLTGETRPEDMVESYVRRSLPYIRRGWRARREYWRAKLQELLDPVGKETIQIQYAPNPAEIDPAVGKLGITFAAPPLASLSEARLTKIRWIARRLTGLAPLIEIRTDWEWIGPGNEYHQQSHVWPQGTGQSYVVDKPGTYELAVTRWVIVHLGPYEVVQNAAIADEVVEVAVKPSTGTWFALDTQTLQQNPQPYGVEMVPARIRWTDAPAGSEQVDLVLQYVSKVEGKRPLEIALSKGIDHVIPLQAKRQGDAYVVQGEQLDQIARAVAYHNKYVVATIVTAILDAGVQIHDAEKRAQYMKEHEQMRRNAEKASVEVHHASLSIHRNGNQLRMRVRISVTVAVPGEAAGQFQGEFEVPGTAVAFDNPPPR